MRPAVEHDLSRSAAAFKDIVWPQISPWFGGGVLQTVEAVTASQMAKDLDILAGIDAWHVNGAVRGIASRIQFGSHAWDTFTVRLKRSSGVQTEYEKRLMAITSSGGWLYPHITVQAYINQDALLSAAACETRDLILFIRDKPEKVVRRSVTDKGGRADFGAVGWDSLGLEHKVLIYRQVPNA